ncbi:MAG TPA: pirin-like C-terminal cupin domain-containing protein [Candidatus Cloacimonadota bacterium]|nr:pirin-like C-terminal cupin domain-containing protein [Candidatus Cloacimonadota bacterium]
MRKIKLIKTAVPTPKGITLQTGGWRIRFLYLLGKPLGEPIAWRGPIVMNTREEIRQAFQDLDDGGFIK